MYTKEYVVDLYKRLAQIPFIDLGPVPNFAPMQQEAIDAFENVASVLEPMHSKNATNDLYLNLGVLGVYDYNGLPSISAFCHSCLAHEEDHKHLIPQFFQQTSPTEFSKQVPTLTSYLANLLDFPGRCRFSVLHSYQDVGWHTHYYDQRCEITFHIAFQTNESVLAQVGPMDPRKLRKIADWSKAPEVVFSQHFSPGRLWLLNSKHAHRFINPSDTDRIHMWGSAWLLDAENNNPINTSFISKLDQAEKAYTGIRMPMQHDVVFPEQW